MLKELIKEGEDLKKFIQSGMVGEFITGEEYAKWIYKCIGYLEKKHTSTTATKRFIEESKHAVGNDVKHYQIMLGIMKALDELNQ